MLYSVLYLQYRSEKVKKFVTQFFSFVYGTFQPRWTESWPSVSLTSFHFIQYVVGRPKKDIVQEVLELLKIFLWSISPKITQKTENDTVGHYWFEWNFNSKFYVRKPIFWAMGESRRCFRLKVIRKLKLIFFIKTKKKRKWLNLTQHQNIYKIL